MKNRLLCIMITFCLVICSFQTIIVSANNTEKELIAKLQSVTIDKIVKTFYSDFDDDGYLDLVAFLGKSYSGDDSYPSTFSGNIWYVSNNNVEIIDEAFRGVGVVIDGSFEPSLMSQNGKNILTYQDMWGNGDLRTHIFFIKDGKPFLENYGGYLVSTENGFLVNNSAYDGCILKKDFHNGLYNGMVRTWKDYWYFWDSNKMELKEYGAIEITTEQFLEFRGAQDILDLITQGKIHNILYRGNGIININIINDTGYWEDDDGYNTSHLIVQYNDNSVNLVNYTDYEGNVQCFRDGFYLKALSPQDAVYAEFKSPRIKVVLNGTEIDFDQPPIMAEDRILVPIRKIAEAMGDTVLWNDEYQTAFIKHEDRGLIIKLLEDHIKIVKNEHWTQWEEKELDIMAFSLNGRTLVPVRAFCESLGADVNWNGDEYTAYITYDFNKETKEMSSETFKNINTVYYALNNDDVSFDAYSDDFNFFYNNRNRQKDAVKMGVSDIWAGVNDLLSGLSNSENIMKNSIEQMLTVIPDNDIVSIDTELLNDIKSFATSGKYIFDEKNGIDDEFLKLHPNLKSLDTSIEAVGTVYDILSFSTEQIAVFLSNYETNIAYIEKLKSILQDNDLLNDELNTSLTVLQQEYSDKFFNIMLNTRDELEKFTITEGTNLVTGGFFSVGAFAWEQLFKWSGITADGQALKTFYGLYCLNGVVDIAYNQISNKILIGKYLPSDVEDLKILDDLQRALKIKTYQCIKIISQDSDTHSMCDEYIKQISKSSILWKKG